ncbi:hypothetical protein [Xanthobacter flavus]|uniref:hypothetical protein n=1 Tax=Xanthobacter flavus TaxID=281 RepID=UPI0037273196
MSSAKHGMWMEVFKGFVLPAAVALIVSFCIQPAVDRMGRRYQARLDQAVSFLGQQDVVVDVAKAFLAEAAKGGNVESARDVIAPIVLRQKDNIRILREIFPEAATVLDEYEKSLDNVVHQINIYNGPSDYGRWRTAFDSVLNNRDRVRKYLAREAGIVP